MTATPTSSPPACARWPGGAEMLARIYGLLFAYLELYESRFEAVVAPVELALIAGGFVSTFERWRAEGSMAATEKVYELCEMLIFALLALTVISRILIRRRKSKLGYAYRGVRTRILQDDGHVEHLRTMVEETPLGRAPGLEPDWENRVPRLAKVIADQASRKLSWRLWLGSDVRWASRERESLSAWFSDFPLSLWHLPADAAGDMRHSAGGDYYSIVVPMTRPSRRSIRKGHRATDMAEIPSFLRDRFSVGPRPKKSAAQAPERLDLLAYLHIYVPRKGTGDPPEESKLLMASIQHLAFLLHWIHGAKLLQKNLWNFTVLCESSNDELNEILTRLGFAPVEREHDGGEGHRYDARSYAGFALFELVVENGTCERADGDNFLVALRDMAARFRRAESGDSTFAPAAAGPAHLRAAEDSQDVS
jgi:hypothetical protein